MFTRPLYMHISTRRPEKGILIYNHHSWSHNYVNIKYIIDQSYTHYFTQAANWMDPSLALHEVMDDRQKIDNHIHNIRRASFNDFLFLQ